MVKFFKEKISMTNTEADITRKMYIFFLFEVFIIENSYLSEII